MLDELVAERKKEGNTPRGQALKLLANTVFGWLWCVDREMGKEVTKIGREIMIKCKEDLADYPFGRIIFIATDSFFVQCDEEDYIAEVVTRMNASLLDYLGLLGKKNSKFFTLEVQSQFKSLILCQRKNSYFGLDAENKLVHSSLELGTDHFPLHAAQWLNGILVNLSRDLPEADHNSSALEGAILAYITEELVDANIDLLNVSTGIGKKLVLDREAIQLLLPFCVKKMVVPYSTKKKVADLWKPQPYSLTGPSGPNPKRNTAADFMNRLALRNELPHSAIPQFVHVLPLSHGSLGSIWDTPEFLVNNKHGYYIDSGTLFRDHYLHPILHILKSIFVGSNEAALINTILPKVSIMVDVKLAELERGQ